MPAEHGSVCLSCGVAIQTVPPIGTMAGPSVVRLVLSGPFQVDFGPRVAVGDSGPGETVGGGPDRSASGHTDLVDEVGFSVSVIHRADSHQVGSDIRDVRHPSAVTGPDDLPPLQRHIPGT